MGFLSPRHREEVKSSHGLFEKFTQTPCFLVLRDFGWVWEPLSLGGTDFGEEDATTQKSVKRSAFSLNEGKAFSEWRLVKRSGPFSEPLRIEFLCAHPLPKSRHLFYPFQTAPQIARRVFGDKTEHKQELLLLFGRMLAEHSGSCLDLKGNPPKIPNGWGLRGAEGVCPVKVCASFCFIMSRNAEAQK